MLANVSFSAVYTHACNGTETIKDINMVHKPMSTKPHLRALEQHSDGDSEHVNLCPCAHVQVHISAEIVMHINSCWL